MKKLSILVALALCVTVGGVYAAWSYAESAVATPDPVSTGIGIEEAITTTPKGEITVSNTLELVIDDNEGTHTPGWDADVAAEGRGGEITITYSPNANSVATTLEYSITISGNSYGENQIFTLTGDVIDEGEIDCPNTTDTVFTITYDEFIAMLPVNEANVLPTLADYNNYSDALNDVTITISVAEVSA